MLEQELRETLARGREQPGVEFKDSRARTDREFAAKVVRACLGMANRRDGGHVIIGVKDDGKGRVQPVGLSSQDAATWNESDLSDTLAEYADPSVSIESEQFTIDGMLLVTVRVSEFYEIPILCKKDYKGILRKGACYIRTRKKPETIEVSSQEDMRELIDLATEKSLRTFVSRAVSAGLLPAAQEGPSDEEEFRSQLGDLSR